MNEEPYPNYRNLSDESLKELKTVMDNRLKSIDEHSEEESIYQTQSPDWQALYQVISDEIAKRGI